MRSPRFHHLLLLALVALLAPCFGTEDSTVNEHKITDTGYTSYEYGFVDYLPNGWDAAQTSGGTFPLVIWFHGYGEKGNGGTELYKVHQGGTGLMGLLDDNCGIGMDVGAIVVAPQIAVGASYNYSIMNRFIERILTTSRYAPYIDQTKIILMGWSLGGGAAWGMAGGGLSPMRWAGCVPFAGTPTATNASIGTTARVWAFHNVDDASSSYIYTRTRLQEITGLSPFASPAPTANTNQLREMGTTSWNSWATAYSSGTTLRCPTQTYAVTLFDQVPPSPAPDYHPCWNKVLDHSEFWTTVLGWSNTECYVIYGSDIDACHEWYQVDGNGDPIGSPTTGPWLIAPGTTVDMYASTAYYRAPGSATPGTGFDDCEFHFTATQSGTYHIFEWHPKPAVASDFGTVTYDITDSSSTLHTWNSDQTVGSGQWNELGTVTLGTGSQYVRLHPNLSKYSFCGAIRIHRGP